MVMVKKVGVAAFIVINNSYLVIGKRIDKNAPAYNQYCVPGGKVEIDENLDDAIKREVKEETGIDIFNENIKPVYFTDVIPDYITCYYLVLLYDENFIKDSIKSPEANKLEISVVNLDNIPDLWGNAKNIFERIYNYVTYDS